MTLLIVYFLLAASISFWCSLTESALLSMSVSDAAAMARQGRPVGLRLQRLKANIDRPLAAILTLNTTANTVGAAGVGAQAAAVFGDGALAIASGVLTLVILVGSEILPKTLGAVHARALAGFVVASIGVMTFVTYPIVRALEGFSGMLRRGAAVTVTREEVQAVAELARTGGELQGAEHDLLENALRLGRIRVAEVMTPRTAAFMLPCHTTVDEAMHAEQFTRFSRIPVFGEGPDDVAGVVLRYDLYEAARRGEHHRPLGELMRPIRAVPDRAPLSSVLEQFGQHGHHLFLVVDEYGGTAGIITLEDVLESALGREIVDETDHVVDMRTLVRAGPTEPGAGPSSESDDEARPEQQGNATPIDPGLPESRP